MGGPGDANRQSFTHFRRLLAELHHSRAARIRVAGGGAGGDAPDAQASALGLLYGQPQPPKRLSPSWDTTNHGGVQREVSIFLARTAPHSAHWSQFHAKRVLIEWRLCCGIHRLWHGDRAARIQSTVHVSTIKYTRRSTQLNHNMALVDPPHGSRSTSTRGRSQCASRISNLRRSSR